jgi:hypothetical protein
MKRLITMLFAWLVVAGIYSSVYACDHSTKTLQVTASSNGKTIRTLVVDATTGCRATESEAVLAFDIDVPGRTTPRFIHIEAGENGRPTTSVLRTAVTLGRAFITTIEAVVGSLIDAASEKTASLV